MFVAVRRSNWKNSKNRKAFVEEGYNRHFAEWEGYDYFWCKSGELECLQERLIEQVHTARFELFSNINALEKDVQLIFSDMVLGRGE